MEEIIIKKNKTNRKIYVNSSVKISSIPNEEVEKLALETEGVKRYTEGQNIVKVIVVPNKIVNIVAK